MTTQRTALRQLDTSSHPDHPAIAEDAVRLRLHGQTAPVTLSHDGRILNGYHTALAARHLGWTHVATITLPAGADTTPIRDSCTPACRYHLGN